MHRRPEIKRVLKAHNLSARTIRLYGLDYLHILLHEGGELFVTKHGLPVLRHLLPSNWNDKKYYSKPENESKRRRLPGSSHPFRIKTKPVDKRSIEIVVKWCRVGQEVFIEKPLSMSTFSGRRQTSASSPAACIALFIRSILSVSV